MKSKFYLGIDVGGSRIKAVLVKDKQIIRSKAEDSPNNLKGLLNVIVKIKDELTVGIDQMEIGGIGFSLAGTLDIKREIMLNSPNIKYLNNQPIKRLLEKKIKTYPIKLEHDVHCFLLAEKERGLAKNLKNVFYLTLGTGIGGALMVDGQIVFGAHGSAGEVGHMIIKLKIKNKKLKIDETLDLEELAANKFIKKCLGVGSIEAERRARAGDKKAREIFVQLGRNLGVGIANIINIFDPEAIILNGGIAEAKEFILSGIKEGIEKFVVSPAAKKTKILFSTLGLYAGSLGAALLFEK